MATMDGIRRSRRKKEKDLQQKFFLHENYWDKENTDGSQAEKIENDLSYDTQTYDVVDKSYPAKEIIAEEDTEEEDTKDTRKVISWAPPKKFISKHATIWMGIGSGFATVIILMVLLSTIFASATITIDPKKKILSVRDLLVKFDTSLQNPLPQQRVLPAEVFKLSKTISADFNATGEKFVREPARGRVRIYNSFSSSPQRLVATTRFLTKSGLLYRLPRGVVVPGAKVENGKIVPQYIEVELVADKPGEKYNLSGEVRLSIPGFKGSAKYEGFYGIAQTGFSGGFEGKTKVVTKEDLLSAQKFVSKKIFDELRDELTKKIPPNFKMIKGLTETSIVSLDAPKEGTRAETFKVEASGVSKVLIFKNEDLVNLIKEIALQNNEDRILIEESVAPYFKVQEVDFEKGIAKVAVSGDFKSKAVVQEEKLALQLKGKKKDSAAAILKKADDIEKFSISIFPPWRFSFPNDPAKIKFVIQ